MTFTLTEAKTTCKRNGTTEVGTITKTLTDVTFVQKIGVTLTAAEMIEIGNYMASL